MNKVTQRIDKLRHERGWTVYKLAQEADLNDQTIYNWFSKKTYPLLPAIEKICEAFGMTLGEFFTESEFVELTPDLKSHIDDWRALTQSERNSVETIIKNYLGKR